MSTTPAPQSVTRLLGLNLTPGKLRGLQRISNPNGTLTMVAMDQNSSMISMITDSLKKKGESRAPTFEEIVEAKVLLARALSPAASAVLVDAYYGVWNSVASFAIPPQTGLLIRVEKSGGGKNKHKAPLGETEAGWSVEKNKRCGADAVKLLAQFEPRESDSAEHQFQLIQKVYEDCQKHDILLLLETVAFPFGTEDKNSASFLDRKVETVIESARWLSRYCDIYKAEFPGWLGKHTDAELISYNKELDKVSERPWVLLSAGVDFPQYKKQVEMSMKCGASGILGGRAFWKEYFTFDTAEERQKFATTTCTGRVGEIHKIVMETATPWFARYGMTMEQLTGMRATENWHFRYGTSSPTTTGGGAAKPDKDAVY